MELVTMLAALLSLIVGCAALLIALRAARMASDNLSQGAYAQAVKGLLDLKRRAAEQPEIFQPAGKSARPQAFARSDTSLASLSLSAAGIWQLSSVLSLIQRGKSAGLTEHQSEGLKAELVQWLRAMPGFYDIYHLHLPLLEARHPELLAFLRERLYTPAFEHAVAQQRKEQELIRRYGANCLKQGSHHRHYAPVTQPRGNEYAPGVLSLENLAPLALAGAKHAC